jgi:hypothetical protein
MYRSRFTRILAVAIAAIISTVEWITQAIAGTASTITRRAAGLAVAIVRSMPAAMSPPGQLERHTRVTGAAEQRMWLVQGNAYQRHLTTKSHPTIEPGWRMCTST